MLPLMEQKDANQNRNGRLYLKTNSDKNSCQLLEYTQSMQDVGYIVTQSKPFDIHPK